MAVNIKQSILKSAKLLERLSLLRINEPTLERVVRMVESVSDIEQFNDELLNNVSPMISPSENQCIFMRDDDRPITTDRNAIMKNAAKTIEDYFVTPSKHKHYDDF